MENEPGSICASKTGPRESEESDELEPISQPLSKEERIALMRKEAAEAEERVIRARIEETEANAAAAERVEKRKAKSYKQQERERRKTAKSQVRASRRGSGGGGALHFLGNLTGATKYVVIVVIAIAVIGLIVGGAAFVNNARPTTVLSSSSLERVVNISQLSSADFVYNGIAEKKNENGEAVYHIAYESHVTAGIDMEEISFEIDENQKVIYPILPEITIQDPQVDESSIEFFESNPDMSIPEYLELCKQDALQETRSSG